MAWKPIKTAPRDGQKVRLKGDDGRTFKGEFKEPHWWMIAPGARIADGHLFHDNGEIMRALEWQPILQHAVMEAFGALGLPYPCEVEIWTPSNVEGGYGPYFYRIDDFVDRHGNVYGCPSVLTVFRDKATPPA